MSTISNEQLEELKQRHPEDTDVLNMIKAYRELVREKDEHFKHVQRFLMDMYATMVDPVDDCELKISELCELLLKRATEDRNKLESSERRISEMYKQQLTDCARINAQTGKIADLERREKELQEELHDMSVQVKNAKIERDNYHEELRQVRDRDLVHIKARQAAEKREKVLQRAIEIGPDWNGDMKLALIQAEKEIV